MVVLEGQRLRLAVVHGLLVADVVDQRGDMRIVHRGHCATKFSDGQTPEKLAQGADCVTEISCGSNHVPGVRFIGLGHLPNFSASIVLMNRNSVVIESKI